MSVVIYDTPQQKWNHIITFLQGLRGSYEVYMFIEVYDERRRWLRGALIPRNSLVIYDDVYGLVWNTMPAQESRWIYLANNHALIQGHHPTYILTDKIGDPHMVNSITCRRKPSQVISVNWVLHVDLPYIQFDPLIRDAFGKVKVKLCLLCKDVGELNILPWELRRMIVEKLG